MRWIWLVHEAIDQNAGLRVLQVLFNEPEVGEAVVMRREGFAPVNAAPGDVARNAGEDTAISAWRMLVKWRRGGGYLREKCSVQAVPFSPHEKGATMLGVGKGNEGGIDAVDLDNGKGISLKEASNIERAKDDAKEALKQAENAGFTDVQVYINVPSVSTSEATGLTKIQNVLGTGVITKAVLFTKDGVAVYRPTEAQERKIKCQESGGTSCGS